MKAAVDFPENVQGIWLETRRSRAARLGVYVFRAGPYLIDSGFSHARRQLLSWPEIDRARACLLTHHDEDHVGNAAALVHRGLTVMARPEVIDEAGRAEHLPLYRRWIWGTAPPSEIEPMTGDFESSGWRFVPLHTPGHSINHYIFHEPERKLVFSGDLYISRRVPVAKPDEDPLELVVSLRRVLALQPDVMFCAHRGRIERPAEALTRKIEWLEEVIGRARELADRGLALDEIRKRVLGREGLIRYFSRGEYTKRNLIETVLRSRGATGG